MRATISSGTALITSNTLDGNPIGLAVAGSAAIYNNIFSNASLIGLEWNEESALQFVDYNVYYDNTTDFSGIAAYGPHDTHGGATSPYVNVSTENYALA
jgi:hypothetical protein